MIAVYHRFLIPRQPYRQPDTLMSLCGRNGPAYQETKVELLTRMRRPLTVSPRIPWRDERISEYSQVLPLRKGVGMTVKFTKRQ